MATANSVNQSNRTQVGSWTDSSGNGNNAVAVAATLNTTGINGQPALTFSSNDYYTVTIGSGTPVR